MREDPAGIYQAIEETHRAYKVPIIITENGISTNCDLQRRRYMERAIYAVGEAEKKIGPENLLGYFVWSFCENSEWNMGRNPQSFGIFELCSQGNLKPRPRAGVEPFTIAAKKIKKDA